MVAFKKKKIPLPRSSLAGILPFERSWQWRVVALAAIILLAGILRIIGIDHIPPAIHADEAPNAWNAHTLLKTGCDQDGISWPLFYIRAFGDYRTAMYAYAIIPFQLIGGMNVWTTRLPAATFAILTILLIYFVGARMFGVTSGIVAAALLSINPWHIQTSRWGHEASLSPFLILASLAGLLWADLPICVQSNKQCNPRPFQAALAGAILGVSCYGYASVRIFLSCFVVSLVIVNWRGWLQCLTNHKGRLAVAGFLLLFAAIYLPLLWKHLTDPVISERARILGYIWQDSDSTAVRVAKVIGRYLDHYGPNFLFLRGDLDPALSPPKGFGLLHWYELPLLILGIMKLAKNVKIAGAYRTLLIWLALYPVGDILFPHVSSHSLRSLPGVGCLTLISALGAVTVADWLCALKRRGTRIGSTAFASVILLLSSVLFLKSYFGEEFSRYKASLSIFGADILEAAHWVGPRLPAADALFVTGYATQIDSLMLFGLNYDPQQWFREPRELVRGPLPDGRFKDAYVYVRYGKVHFLLTPASIAALNSLVQEDRLHRLLFIVRPGELGLQRYAKPVHEILGANGLPRLWVFDIKTLKGSLVSESWNLSH